MELKMYSVRDQKGGIFHPPFFKRNLGEAQREFHRLTNNKDSMLNMFPEDYDFYFIGDYDDTHGTFKLVDTPQHLEKAINLVQKPGPAAPGHN